MLYLLSVVALFTAGATAHSWLGCADYRGPVDYYDETKCRAYPRYWQTARSAFLATQANGYQLGGDSGYNYQPGAPCNLPMASPDWKSAYSTAYPYAIYEQGSIYCLAWPTKNHVAATCTNQFIPDTTMIINRSAVGLTSDPSAQSGFGVQVVDYFGVHVNGQIDCLGYQRSPKFCDNTDKAMATGCIQIPNNLAVGHYVFQWYWVFNPGAPYTTCWDVEVVAAGSGRGAGGVTGASSIVDNLSPAGDTCRRNWAALNQPASTPSTTPTTTVINTTTTTTPTVTSTTDYNIIRSQPSSLPTKIGSKFSVRVEYKALAARTITVDIINPSYTDVWFGSGHKSVAAGSGTVTIEVTVAKTLTSTPGFLLRAWIVDQAIFDQWVQCNYCDTVAPWTEELDRRDSAILVGALSTSNSGNTGSGSSGEYTGGDIAATFFGTGLILLAIFAGVYWFYFRPRMTTGK